MFDKSKKCELWLIIFLGLDGLVPVPGTSSLRSTAMVALPKQFGSNHRSHLGTSIIMGKSFGGSTTPVEEVSPVMNMPYQVWKSLTSLGVERC
jgi:hypothetical protein